MSGTVENCMKITLLLGFVKLFPYSSLDKLWRKYGNQVFEA